MNDFDDYQLDPLEEQGTIDLAEELQHQRGRRRWPWIALALLVVLVGAVALSRWLDSRETVAEDSGPAAAAAEPAPTEVEIAEPPIDLPPLDDSDAWLREVVAQLSEHPQLASWLVNEDLARRLVAAAVNIAEGESPRPHIRFLAPGSGYRVTEVDGDLRPAPDSHRRYDVLAAVVGSLHVDGTARFYRNVRPLLEEAYRELGYPDGDFDAVAAAAVRRLLETPVVEAPRLVEFASSYKFADPELERLSEAQKHFLRLGPSNLLRVQSRVKAIALRAGLDVD